MAIAGSLAALCAATPALAQSREPVTDDTVDAADVALSPLADLNLARDPIPTVLVRAREEPYADDGLEACSDIRQQIGNLDAVLGEDYDTLKAKERKLTAGKVAQSVVNMFIPFRGVIREVSGANDHAHEFRESIVAGLMRRAYLKGLGEARGCEYPARPATPEMLAGLMPAEEAAGGNFAQSAPVQPQETGQNFVSRPVVQSTD